MSHSLQDKVAIITGGGGGIGRAIAATLAKEKMLIVLLGGNDREKLAATAEAVEEYTECLMLPGDLTDLEFLAEGQLCLCLRPVVHLRVLVVCPAVRILSFLFGNIHHG